MREKDSKRQKKVREGGREKEKNLGRGRYEGRRARKYKKDFLNLSLICKYVNCIIICFGYSNTEIRILFILDISIQKFEYYLF